MSKVTRYTCEIETIGGDYYVDAFEVSPIPDPQGEFVKYSDYELLEQAYADLEKKYAVLKEKYLRESHKNVCVLTELKILLDEWSEL